MAHLKDLAEDHTLIEHGRRERLSHVLAYQLLAAEPPKLVRRPTVAYHGDGTSGSASYGTTRQVH